MCGIAGFRSNSVPDPQGTIRAMMDSIAHRGPDDEGQIDIDNVSFGHKRLSIIDIEHGHQPMQTEDQRFTLIFNGEIYNYLELRELLIAKNHKLRTHSDTEVLLLLYVEFGKDVVDYLNGMFAFAIYDAQEKELFLARDHFGIKPLYYYHDQDNFVFASEIKALLKHPAVPREVDQRSIYEYLTFQFVLKKHTLFQSINKLEPGTYLRLKDGQITEKREYWKLEYYIDDTKTENQFLDELLDLLENSLLIQVRSDVPVGSHLSGGLDSSAVAVLASQNYAGQLKTFTGGFKESASYDETNYARIVSDSISSEHFEIFPTANDFIDCFEKLVYHMDEPGAGPGIFPQYMVSKLASEQVKVVLGGQGGDEVFGGYARYAIAYLEQCIKGSIFETQEEGQHVVTLPSIIPNLALLREYVPLIQSQFSSGLFGEMDRRYFKMIDRSPNLHQMYAPEFLSERHSDTIFSKFTEIFNNPETPSYFNKMTYFDVKTLLPTLLQVEDRVSMAVSLESRVPLLDKRIVELSSRMSPTLKFSGGKTKYMLSKALKNILPRETLERKDKMGFPVPINEWMQGPLKEFVLDIFNSQRARERGVYNIQAINSHISKMGKFNRDLWGAINLELWFKNLID